MDIINKDVTPHPQLLDVLFAHKSQVKPLFAEMLRRYEIDHIAVTHINLNQEILTFSSTPAIEFNLFNSGLWRLDNTYNPAWFEKRVTATWQSLYHPERYDELYYLKQLKPHYPIGYSFATKADGGPVIYSIASRKTAMDMQDITNARYEIFYGIQQRCAQLLLPLLTHYKPSSEKITIKH